MRGFAVLRMPTGSRPMRERGGRGAFTLVELLVVMSVISILAAILLPVTMRARGLARNTHCCANLGQLGRAVDLYVDSNETWYPCAASLPSVEPSAGLARICDLLVRYSAPESFLCPDDDPVDPEYGFGTYFEGEGSSYEWVGVFNGHKQGSSLARRPGRPAFFKVEETPMMCDYEPFHARGSRTGVNAVFTDSHVESF